MTNPRLSTRRSALSAHRPSARLLFGLALAATVGAPLAIRPSGATAAPLAPLAACEARGWQVIDLPAGAAAQTL
ncbi:MAG: hypothetical protein ABI780_06570, partial [Ardenticatenales bacterium]